MGESLETAPDETAPLDDEDSHGARLAASLTDLRAALLKLKPTGPDGFEGLLARVLGRISGQDFRLAKSGLQNGKDGATAATVGNHVAFEGKRYDTSIDATDVQAKITQLIASLSPPDLWVLGATVEVGAQLVDTIQSAAAKNGIGTLILDWSSASTVPPLAAACALAHEETDAFLGEHVDDPACVQRAGAALAAIRKSESFRRPSDDLIRALKEPSLGVAIARTANGKWLESAFADRTRASATFGQVLAPNAPGPLPLRQRSALVQQVHRHLTAAQSRKMVAIVGREGSGKSWLLAQSWLQLDDRPLMVWISATDVKPGAEYGSLTPLLIAKLIRQTDDSDDEITRKRWERRLKSWRAQANGALRFVLCVDGLNQQPDFDWPRWLDGATDVVEQLGGNLIVTARESYFDERIRTVVRPEIITVSVPEWTEPELREILAAEAVDGSKIKPAVFDRLRNPRILGIAFDLQKRGEVQDFNELSVERLLFEHIRIGARDGNVSESPEQFSKRLAQHAQAIVDRVRQQQREDVLVFDRPYGERGHTLTADLLAVTAEHFFKRLPEDATLYTLTDSGLSLALGLAIIKALQKAARNARNPADALDELIQPIAALDKTADAVFSAVMVSSVDELCSLAIRRALICGFIHLQNIDAQNYAAFAAVVRKSTDEAMSVLFDLSAKRPRYAANKDWLLRALRECRRDPKCWAVISTHLSDWLRFYSLDPQIALMGPPGHDSAHMIVEETQKRTKALEQRMAELSLSEREFLAKKMLERKDHNPCLLHENAFEILVGMPLASFAEQLVACSFAWAINPSFRAPYDEYRALIRFNRWDWQETRRRLLEAAAFLGQQTTSGTGKWALVAILRGISTVEDGNREEQLVEELTKDRQKLRGWRLVERYCATDPCDPDSVRPDNVDVTADSYARVNVEELWRHRCMSEADHFVRDALPGVARFVPDAAIATMRRIAQSTLARGVEDLVQILPSLKRHCAALDSETIGKLVEIANTLSPLRAPEYRDTPMARLFQDAIQIAFPHLSGDEQLDLLAQLPSHEPPTPELAEVLKPATPEKLEWALVQAKESAEYDRALSALLFARYSGTVLTERSRTLVGQFAEDERSSVRAGAMDIIAHLKDRDLIERVIATGWSAALLDPDESHFEILYGSLIVIDAAEREMLSADEALGRITPRLYGKAAEVLEPTCHQAIGARLNAAIAKALNIDLSASGVEQEQARLIVEKVGFQAVDAYVSTSQDYCIGLTNKFLRLDDRTLIHVHNFGLRLARSISHHDVALARKLFELLAGGRAFENVVYGFSGVSLEAVCVWKSADGALDALRAHRLDGGSNDYELAQEVLAALMAGKSRFLEEYVHKNLQCPEPAAIARALMVIGFGEESPAYGALLSDHAATKGLIGKAGKAALFAYNRNRWARHWFEKMCATDSAEEFWTISTLFLKIVDARFALWRDSFSRAGTAMPRFAPSIMNSIERRVNAWKGKREQTLCGDKAPGESYVASN